MSSPHLSPANTGRLPWIDWLKFIAMLMVVAIHTSQFGLYAEGAFGNILWNTVTTLQIFGVPIFFMVSGYLMLGRSSERTSWRYCSKRAAKSILLIVICFLLLDLLVTLQSLAQWALTGQFVLRTHGPVQLVQEILATASRNSIMGQLWFLWTYAFICLCVPLLARVYNRPGRSFAWLTAFFVVLSAAAWLFNLHWSYLYPGHSFDDILPLTARPWFWFMFFTLGASIKRYGDNFGGSAYDAKRRNRIITLLIVALVAAFLICAFTQRFYFERFSYVRKESTLGSPEAIIFTVSLFLLFKVLRPRTSRFIRSMSRLFLPVYLVHVTILGLFYSLFWHKVDPTDAMLQLAFYPLVLVSSVAVAWLLMRIPILKSLLKI